MVYAPKGKMRHRSLIPLSHDHHHGLALALRCRKQALGQMKPAGIEGLRERAEEFRRFVSDNLERHFEAEEKILFPFVSSLAPESRPLIEELLKGHEQLREYSGRLEEETAIARLLFDVGDLLERHIRLEERELFPLFENHAAAAETERVEVEIKRILESR
jgi:hemerythrin-like domain-containing protein